MADGIRLPRGSPSGAGKSGGAIETSSSLFLLGDPKPCARLLMNPSQISANPSRENHSPSYPPTDATREMTDGEFQRCVVLIELQRSCTCCAFCCFGASNRRPPSLSAVPPGRANDCQWQSQLWSCLPTTTLSLPSDTLLFLYHFPLGHQCRRYFNLKLERSRRSPNSHTKLSRTASPFQCVEHGDSRWGGDDGANVVAHGYRQRSSRTTCAYGEALIRK